MERVSSRYFRREGGYPRRSECVPNAFPPGLFIQDRRKGSHSRAYDLCSWGVVKQATAEDFRKVGVRRNRRWYAVAFEKTVLVCATFPLMGLMRGMSAEWDGLVPELLA